jgi:sortase B
VQTTDNQYYLTRTWRRASNANGAIFMDHRNSPLWRQWNTIIYGHNMGSRSSLNFAALPGLTNPNNFIRSPFIIIDDGIEVTTWVIFALAYADGSSNAPAGSWMYNLPMFPMGFQNFLDQLAIRTVLHTGVDVQVGDFLLTLSTCDYIFTDARLGVFARKLRADETQQSFTFTTSTVRTNHNALYPPAYYTETRRTMPDEETLLAALR